MGVVTGAHSQAKLKPNEGQARWHICNNLIKSKPALRLLGQQEGFMQTKSRRSSSVAIRVAHFPGRDHSLPSLAPKMLLGHWCGEEQVAEGVPHLAPLPAAQDLFPALQLLPCSVYGYISIRASPAIDVPLYAGSSRNSHP